MTWVMITHPLPPLADDTVQPPKQIPSPPRGSIHWAAPSTIERYAMQQQMDAVRVHAEIPLSRKQLAKYITDNVVDPTELLTPDDRFAPGMAGFAEPNWVGAMMIRWQGSDVRIFPHEFSKVSEKNISLLLHGDAESDGAYDLIVSDDVAAQKLITGVLEEDGKPVMEAALLDGCNRDQAIAVALGQDIFDDDYEVAPIGWYRLREEYAQFFFGERPVKRTRKEPMIVNIEMPAEQDVSAGRC